MRIGLNVVTGIVMNQAGLTAGPAEQRPAA